MAGLDGRGEQAKKIIILDAECVPFSFFSPFLFLLYLSFVAGNIF